MDWSIVITIGGLVIGIGGLVAAICVFLLTATCTISGFLWLIIKLTISPISNSLINISDNMMQIQLELQHVMKKMKSTKELSHLINAKIGKHQYKCTGHKKL